MDSGGARPVCAAREVAQLAGVGTTWYTWLEQGRDVRASSEVLSALADALHLDQAERRHLFLLSDRPQASGRSTGAELVSQSLCRMLSSLTNQAAYVTGRRWDVLAWNAAAKAVFGDYGTLEGDARNIMHMVFADPAHRRPADRLGYSGSSGSGHVPRRLRPLCRRPRIRASRLDPYDGEPRVPRLVAAT